jgi:hypothetical protein
MKFSKFLTYLARKSESSRARVCVQWLRIGEELPVPVCDDASLHVAKRSPDLQISDLRWRRPFPFENLTLLLLFHPADGLRVVSRCSTLPVMLIHIETIVILECRGAWWAYRPIVPPYLHVPVPRGHALALLEIKELRCWHRYKSVHHPSSVCSFPLIAHANVTSCDMAAQSRCM